MALEWRPGEHAIVAPRGEIDLATAPTFRDELFAAIDRGARRVIVDLTGVTLVDSTALAVLIQALRQLRPRQGALGLVVDDPQILRAFEITGLERLFRVYGSREEAIADSMAAEATRSVRDG